MTFRSGIVTMCLTAAMAVPAWRPRPVSAQNAAPAPAAQAAGEGDVVVVEAEGEGVDKDQAVRAALRAALEKGGKQEIFSDSKVENFQLMHDTIIARAEGIVTDYEIIRGPTKVAGGGTVKVAIKARVSKKVLVDSWGAIQNVLNQIGRPKIMVSIVERIDGKTEEGSLLESRIEERLNKSGFDLVAKQAMAALKEKESADAAAEDNVAKVQAIAKDAEADFFIIGTANANQAGIEQVYGTDVAFYNCDVQVKAYYTDSGKLLASAGIPVTRGGARGKKEFSPQAGKQALGFAGENVVEEIYQQVMKNWSIQIGAGGELILEVEGIRFPAANRLKKAISEIEGVNSANMKFTKGIATYRINARLSAQDLAEKLGEGDFEKLMEITDLKLNRIQAKGAGGGEAEEQ